MDVTSNNASVLKSPSWNDVCVIRASSSSIKNSVNILNDQNPSSKRECSKNIVS